MSEKNNCPHHVAIIMDGNRRWAKKNNLPPKEGHKEGINTIHRIVLAVQQTQIKIITLFAFSSENWKRSKKDVSLLISLMTQAITLEGQKLIKQNIKLRIIGDISVFNSDMQRQINALEKKSQDNNGLILVIALNYGGKWDIVQAVQKIASKIHSGETQLTQINDELITKNLCLADLPDPDLCIRTSGEQRISNFLLWQLAYTELYTSPTLWPDFKDDDLILALNEYKKRQRRYGFYPHDIQKENK